jgi:hypothetical protein
MPTPMSEVSPCVNLPAALLRYAACPDERRADRIVVLLRADNPLELAWVLEAGLGALLYRAVGDRRLELPAHLGEALLSEELTAKVRHAQRTATACEVIDVCEDLRIPTALLKGVSICEQYYPAGHLRPMSDIDILVPAEAEVTLEERLIARGYLRAPGYPSLPGQHHGAPLYHPDRRIWVEVHRALFPADSGLCRGRLFDASTVWALCTHVDFAGRKVGRLSDELQLVYIASAWMRDLTLRQVHPSFIAGLLDAVYLLQRCAARLNWDRMIESLDNETASASLLVLLSYLDRRRLGEVPASTPRRVRQSQSLIGPLQLHAIQLLVDRYLLGARPWKYPLPQPVPGRYSLRRQLGKRLLPWLMPQGAA